MYLIRTEDRIDLMLVTSYSLSALVLFLFDLYLFEGSSVVFDTDRREGGGRRKSVWGIGRSNMFWYYFAHSIFIGWGFSCMHKDRREEGK